MQKEKHEKAYARGVENAKNQDVIGGLCHELMDVVTCVVPKTSEYESEEAGYHDYMNGKTK